ncbi:hypothetical protein C8Q74DRAFT_477191 [Fomes fomentarius]|nr:hypothetical protein C8Q74DRAFT_477191 [Fomes fomentarius]
MPRVSRCCDSVFIVRTSQAGGGVEAAILFLFAFLWFHPCEPVNLWQGVLEAPVLMSFILFWTVTHDVYSQAPICSESSSTQSQTVTSLLKLFRLMTYPINRR